MKLFRKKKESDAMKTRLRESIIPLGPLRFSTTSRNKQQLTKKISSVRTKEDAQLRFVNKLYQLSYAHGGNSIASLPDVVTSESSSPTGTSTHTEPCTITPESSPATSPASTPARVKPPVTVAARLVNTKTANKGSRVLEAIDAVFTQITACTSDFFGEGISAECVNARDMQQNDKPRTLVTQYPPVPATITFESAVLPAPPRTKSRRSLLRPSIVVDKSIIDGADELDDIVQRVEQHSMHNSIAYKPPKASGEALIDNVWVVSSFVSEERKIPLPEELSVTSSIPTRISHLL